MDKVRGGGKPVGQPRVEDGINPAPADGGQKVKGSRSKAKAPDFKGLSLQEIRAMSDRDPGDKPVRLRFAPSPTGHLHIGGARTALMNYLFAKKMGGEFVLRIEDTDTLRSRQEFTEAIIDGLRWLGIESDIEPVFQSQRAELYAKHTQRLLDEGKAYKDDTGAVWFKMPNEGDLVVKDRVKGRIAVDAAGDGANDFVIQRADGSATFLLANVVDDGEMGITHVIRGDDHLTNAARQIPLYHALGFEVPAFYHVPLIFGDDGNKLSKRHGATSVIDYQEQGYDPEIMVNHLARLGMSFGTEEMLDIETLAQHLKPYGFNKAPSRIDFPKLDFRNRTLLTSLPGAELEKEVRDRNPELAERLGPNGLEGLVEGVRGRATTFAEIVGIGEFILAEPTFRRGDIDQLGGVAKDAVRDLKEVLEDLPADQWTGEGLERAISAFAERNKAEFKDGQRKIRWLLTGIDFGLPIDRTLQVLGKEASLARLAAKPRPTEPEVDPSAVENLRPGSFLHRMLLERFGEDPRDLIRAPEASPETIAKIRPFGVASKAARVHGDVFAKQLPALKSLFGLGDRLEGRRGAIFHRALEQIYNQIGRQLDALPPDDRQAFAADTLEHLGGLAKRVGTNDLLVPTLMAFVDLIGQHAETPARAREQVEALLDQSAGRSGRSSLLNAYPNIVGQLERAAGASSPELREKALTALLAGTPRGDVEQVHVSLFAQALQRHLENEEPAAALEATASELVSSGRDAQKEVREKLAQAGLGDLGEPALALLDAKPMAPAGFAEGLHAVVTQPAAAQLAGLDAVLSHAATEAEAADSLVRFLGESLPQLARSDAEKALFSKAAAAGSLPAFAKTLLEGGVERSNHPDKAGLKKAVAKVGQLPPADAARVLSALWGRLGQPSAVGLTKGLISAVRDPAFRTDEALSNFADRYVQFAATFPEPSTLPLSLAMKTQGVVDAESAAALRPLVEAIGAVEGAPVDELLAPTPDGQPGLIDLSRSDRYMQNPLPHLEGLANAVQNAKKLKPEQQLAILRHVIAMADELGALDPARAPLLPRVQADLVHGLENPLQLASAGGQGMKAWDLRAKGKPKDAAAYAEAYDVLPPTLVFTAGRHLSNEQLTWLTDLLGRSRNRQNVRDLRDAVFAAVESEHVDLIDAMSKASSKDALAMAGEVANAYRLGRIDEFSFDAAVARLRGEDPPPAAEGAPVDAEADAANAPLGLPDLAGVQVTPEGQALFDQHGESLKKLAAYLGADSAVYNTKGAHFRGQLMKALKDVAAGRWPRGRYEGEAMESHFEGLSPEQVEIWSTTEATGEEAVDAVPPEEDPDIQEALTLFQGLEQAIPKEVELAHADFPDLAWNEASRDVLREKYESLVGELRQVEKGSKEQAQKIAEIEAVRPRLAAVELVVALKEAFAGGLPNRATLLGKLAPLAQAGIGAVKDLGGLGSSRALREALYSLPEPPKKKAIDKSATFVQDEDSLDAFMNSFGSSCMQATGTHKNRASLVEVMTTGQYKLSRIYQNGKPAFRGFVRLYRAKLDGYEGHVLFADKAVGVDSWSRNAPDSLAKLHFRHVIEKAKRMGIPAIFHDPKAAQAAEEMGLESKKVPVTLLVSKGETGIHHVQAMDLGHYMMQWQPVSSGYNGPSPEADARFGELSGDLIVVMP